MYGNTTKLERDRVLRERVFKKKVLRREFEREREFEVRLRESCTASQVETSIDYSFLIGNMADFRQPANIHWAQIAEESNYVSDKLPRLPERNLH